MAKLHLAQEILNLIYPVGSIYLSTSTTNPSTYFGGTWEQVAKESYLLGYSANNTWFNKPGQNKGSANGPGNWNTNDHTLTINEIPKHTHSLRSNRTAGGPYATPVFDFSQGHSSDDVNAVLPAGGGKGHNHFHVSPYYIVVVWKRTA